MGAYHGNRPAKGIVVPMGASGDYLGSIDQDAFMKGYHDHIERLLQSSTVSVACLRSDPDVILGYSVSQPGILHWVFVKPDWRRLGIANNLIPKDTKTVTGFTRVGEIIRKRKLFKFNPFI